LGILRIKKGFQHSSSWFSVGAFWKHLVVLIGIGV
jgi:hypothetical protein